MPGGYTKNTLGHRCHAATADMLKAKIYSPLRLKHKLTTCMILLFKFRELYVNVLIYL